MMYYETMYIVHPAIESGRLKDLILSVEKNMLNLGGQTCAISVWGKKKLAYSINKERYGMYVLFQFKSDEDSILHDLPSLDNQLGLSNSTETIVKEEKSEEETTSEEKSEEEATSEEKSEKEAE